MHGYKHASSVCTNQWPKSWWSYCPEQDKLLIAFVKYQTIWTFFWKKINIKKGCKQFCNVTQKSKIVNCDVILQSNCSETWVEENITLQMLFSHTKLLCMFFLISMLCFHLIIFFVLAGQFIINGDQHYQTIPHTSLGSDAWITNEQFTRWRNKPNTNLMINFDQQKLTILSFCTAKILFHQDIGNSDTLLPSSIHIQIPLTGYLAL